MELENALGLLRIHVRRGINLAVRDVRRRSSDPYVIIRTGNQKVKTRVINQNINPAWNDDLTLLIFDQNAPVLQLSVYDRDTFSRDDKMGDAAIDIKPFLQAVNMQPAEGLPTGFIISTVIPNRENCLAEQSHIAWINGKVVQNMFIRLLNVECGEVELELHWIQITNSKAVSHSLA